MILHSLVVPWKDLALLLVRWDTSEGCRLRSDMMRFGFKRSALTAVLRRTSGARVEVAAAAKLHQSYPTHAAAKLHQSYPTLCDPIDSSPPGFSVSGILQARIMEWVAISFSNA